VNAVALGDDVPGLDPLIAGLLAGTETYDSVIDVRATCATFGVRPTPLDDVLPQLISH
jgi:hypothetical protein